MGAGQSVTTVSVLAEGEPDSPFSIRRCPGYEKGPLRRLKEEPDMQAVVLKSFRQFSNSDFLGQRKIVNGVRSNEFTFITYKEGEEIMHNLGSGLYKIGLQQQSFFGIYSENRIEWGHSINVSAVYDFVLTSLYETFGVDALNNIVKHSRMETIFVSETKMKNLLTILNTDRHQLKRVVLISDSPDKIEEWRTAIKNFSLDFYTFWEICEIGKNNRIELPKINPETPHFICYSSGTTGSHKGVIISHRSFANNVLGVDDCFKFTPRSRHLSYLPLSHVFERIAYAVTMYAGSKIGFFSGEVSLLSQDMQILKPTHLAAVPRVLQRISDQVNSTIRKASLVQRGIFWAMFYWKRFFINRGSDSFLANLLVFNKVKSTMGGCIEQFIIGGAAMDSWTHEFMEVATGWPMRVGYGLSEVGSGCVLNPLDVRYTKPGTSGGPLAHVEVKLEPLSDYDDPTCGEILIGGELLCSGYLYDEEETEKLFTGPDRKWVHTGDVAKWDKDGYLQVVDRLRSLFKLSQGEYVAAELLTKSYELALIVEQIFIYGDSSRECLIAIVVPTRNQVASFLQKTGLTDEEFKNACLSGDVLKEVKRQLDQIATKENFVGFQKIRSVYCDWEPWTIENNMLTPTFKLKRRVLTQHYQKIIDDLYKSLSTK